MDVECTHGVLIEGSHEHHGGKRVGIERLEHAEAVQVGHLDVEEYHLWLEGRDPADSVASARAFGNDGCFAGLLEQAHQAASRNVLVVDDDDGDHVGVSEEEGMGGPASRSRCASARASDCSRGPVTPCSSLHSIATRR